MANYTHYFLAAIGLLAVNKKAEIKLLTDVHANTADKYYVCNILVEFPKATDPYFLKKHPDKQISYHFSEAWFSVNHAPMDIDKAANIENITDVDKKLILRLAYYLWEQYKAYCY